MEDFVFSYNNYRKICEYIRQEGNLLDYEDILKQKPERFVILRHDVEFSPKRALDLAAVEHEQEVTSTFFFQVTNNSYNVLSGRNLDICRQIRDLGHKIGLHFHLNGMTNLELIKERIGYEAELLSHYLGFAIDRFSFHRPPALVLENDLAIDGLINAYAPAFFTYYSNTSTPPHLNIKYVADSKNAWQYTAPYLYPTREFFAAFDKIQLLCHPYSWTDTGYDTLSNLRSLIEEERNEFIQTLNSETKYVRYYLQDL